MRKTWLLVGACGGMVWACGDDGAAGGGYRGDDPHLVISGSLNDEELDVDVSGGSAVEVAELVCEREYEVPVIDGAADPSMATLVGFEISAIVKVDGEERQLEIDLEGPGIVDFVGKRLAIKPDGEELAEGEVVVEAKWTRVSDEAELFDESADTGEVTLELLSGEPGEGGVIIPDDEGTVGLSGELRFSATQVVSVSFSADCGANDISELVSAP